MKQLIPIIIELEEGLKALDLADYYGWQAEESVKDENPTAALLSLDEQQRRIGEAIHGIASAVRRLRSLVPDEEAEQLDRIVESLRFKNEYSKKLREGEVNENA